MLFNVPVEPIRALNPSQLSKRTALLRDGSVRQDPRWSRTVRGVTALTRITEISRTVEQGTGARHASRNQAVKDTATTECRARELHGCRRAIRHLTVHVEIFFFFSPGQKGWEEILQGLNHSVP